MKYLAAAALVLGACTTESHDIDFVIGYGDIPSTPAYIAYRDGNGAWQTPARNATGTYTLHVSGPYEVIYVCTDDAGAFDIEEARATPEGTQFRSYPSVPLTSGGCQDPAGTDPVLPFTVTGRTAQPAELALGGAALRTSSLHPTFSASVASGTYPLLATDVVDDDKPATRVMKRMLDVTGDLDLGTIDIASGALPTEPIEIPVHGNAGAGFWSVYGPWGLSLARDTNQSGSVSLPMLAASQRDADDHYAGIFSVYSGKVSQTYDNNEVELATSIELIPAPTVTFTDAPLTATWTPDDVSYASLSTQLGGGTATRNVFVTPRWLAETGTTTLAFADDPADFPATWSLDASGTYYTSLSLRQFGDVALNYVTVDR
jgi:hypothetical protein